MKWVANIWEVTQIKNMNKGQVHWPVWVEYLSHLSHLSTAFNSSCNFYIYAAKVSPYTPGKKIIKLTSLFTHQHPDVIRSVFQGSERNDFNDLEMNQVW